MTELPIEKRFRMFLNHMALEMSRTHPCERCGSTEGLDVFEEPDEEMEALMPENSAIGTCKHCGAVTMYSMPDLFPFDPEQEEDVKIECRILS